MGPSPLQPINPILIAGDYKPIGENEPSSPDDVINKKDGVVDTGDNVKKSYQDINNAEEESSSITSLEDVTLSDYPEIAVKEGEEPSPVIPQIDLDVLEKISYAPPIAVEQIKKVRENSHCPRLKTIRGNSGDSIWLLDKRKNFEI